jgi:DNA sulfur modification protein DndD
MKIETITLTNFRQYKDKNSIDLSTTDGKNIVVIGGKNGYGKTNLLMSLVWCLYGEDISRIDENFRREIQKEGNYSKFLKSCLNWAALSEGVSQFSVELVISEVELPNTVATKSDSKYTCKIIRSFDSESASDYFDIKIEGISKQFLKDEEDKINFIHDYIIPLEASKFVFFDAEKIANWAELSTKEEGNVLNDALGKILGLDIYESLINDLLVYTDTLRKDSATNQVKQQITATENGIKLNSEKIDELENEIIKKDNSISELKLKISRYESFLIKHANKNYNEGSIEELYKQRNELIKKEKETETKFNELSELIPIAIAAGKLEEVSEHLFKQDQESLVRERQNELIEKNGLLIEKLFNNPPFPAEGDISFSKKMFYAEKAKRIIEDVFGKIDENDELEFEHDLTKADRDLIIESFDYIRKQTKELFGQTIDSFNRVKNEIIEIDRTIKRIESDLEDEEIIDYTNKKNDAERKIEKLIEERGALISQKSALIRANESLNQRLQIDLKKISVSEQKKRKLDRANQYIKALEEFVIEQKRAKSTLLEQAIFEELQKLLHKLKESNSDRFIAAVKAETLPDNDGLRVTLFNSEGVIIPKESLGQGEKQIYISALIKAILNQSAQEFPIFIDTPLGRLDDDHIKNILLYYYPDLAKQVVILATNNEIPSSRLKLINESISKTYILDHKESSTKFKKGYFISYEN